MSNRLPTFNVAAGIRRSTTPLANPPDAFSNAQLYTSRRHEAAAGPIPTAGQWVVALIYFPKRTDVRDGLNAPGADTIELPSGTGRFYQVVHVDDAARGFINEFRIAWVYKLQGPGGLWPTPIP